MIFFLCFFVLAVVLLFSPFHGSSVKDCLRSEDLMKNQKRLGFILAWIALVWSQPGFALLSGTVDTDFGTDGNDMLVARYDTAGVLDTTFGTIRRFRFDSSQYGRKPGHDFCVERYRYSNR